MSIGSNRVGYRLFFLQIKEYERKSHKRAKPDVDYRIELLQREMDIIDYDWNDDCVTLEMQPWRIAGFSSDPSLLSDF